MNEETPIPRSVLAHYELQEADIQTVRGGNINISYAVRGADAGEYILQRLNPIFAVTIHEDIETVTSHLQQKGLLTPRLIPNQRGELYTEHGGDIWRLMTRISGMTITIVKDGHTAREAAGLLARFHVALADLDYQFRNPRIGIHDMDRHLRELQLSLKHGREHPRQANIRPLAEEIMALAAHLPDPPATEDRKVHGDPKITNILFDSSTGKAKCLIDLDTLGNMPLALELGDALRSWCNPHGEDTQETEFSLALFKAAVEGYAEQARGFILEQEWRAILPATYRIYIELAARFCADAFNESYFNWDPRRFDSRSEHNEIRARGQLQAAKSLQSQYQQAEKILERIFG